ncbi:MAG: efflux RND transporter periplasmic adaptor subunit [Bacteroidaceae bacterium]
MKARTFILSASLLLLASCGGKVKQNKENNQAIAVKVMNPISSRINEIVTNGTVESNEIANIGTRMMGYIQKIYVTKGTKVNKGQLLLNISDNDLQAKQAQAQSMVEQAQAAYDVAAKDEARFSRLLQRESCSQKEYEQANLQYKSRKAQLAAARQGVKEVEANRSYTQIHAPFSGVVTNIVADQGSLASPGMPLITIEKSGDMVIQTQLSEQNIDKVQAGMKANVFVEAAHQKFTASVSERSHSSIATGGQYKVTLNIPSNIQKELLSGMHANVTFAFSKEEYKSYLNSSPTSLWIPTNLLVNEEGLHGVYIASPDNVAVLHWLRLGKTNGEQVEVLSGINKNDRIIIPNKERIQNGTLLSIK